MSPIPLLLLLALPSFAPAVHQDDDAQADGNKLVKVALLADRAELQPGSTFTLAVRCHVEKRWHVYWSENAGDAGLPFTAEITGPAGWQIGPVRSPWPKREEVEGDIVEYVHEGELVLMADVKVPADAKVGTQAAFDVSARWLVCTTVCVQGKGGASLTLPVSAAEKPANEADFKAWRKRMPRPWSEMTRAFPAWSGDPATPKLTLVVPGATALEFYPYKSETTELTSRHVDVGKQGASLVLDFKFESKAEGAGPAARGVLWVKTDKGEAAYVLEQPYKKA